MRFPSCIQEGSATLHSPLLYSGGERHASFPPPVFRRGLGGGLKQKYMHELHNYLKYKPIRKKLRNNPTYAEKLLWLGLKSRQGGYKWRRQQSIGNFVADFYCSKLKLVIEVDGVTHNQADVQNKDKIKEQFLKNNYFKVIRFTDDEVLGNIEKVLKKIRQICDGLDHPPTPS